jgi:serine O-acetyltransferase
MHFGELVDYCKADLYRYKGATGSRAFLKNVLFTAGYKYTFWMRTAKYLHSKNNAYLPLKILSKLILRRYTYKFGIEIPFNTSIGKGLFIGHFGGITVNGESVIGKNFNLSQGVTLGQANRGENKGCPVIGDNVYIGPGAKIVGNVRINDGAAIGANCVVTKEVPINGVSVGIPNKTISLKGSGGYVNYTVN